MHTSAIELYYIYSHDYIVFLKETCLPAGGFGAANICLLPAGTLLDLDLEEVADFTYKKFTHKIHTYRV